jgi:hypothetical protein
MRRLCGSGGSGGSSCAGHVGGRRVCLGVTLSGGGSSGSGRKPASVGGGVAAKRGSGASGIAGAPTERGGAGGRRDG